MKRKIVFLGFVVFLVFFLSFTVLVHAETSENSEDAMVSSTPEVKISDAFPDKIFSEFIMDELQKKGISINSVEDTIKLEDLDKITTIDFYGLGSNLQSIQGVEYLKNLERIVIVSAKLEDYSPILNLKKLRTINFSGTKVSSLDGIIDYIKNNSDRALYISIRNCYITDFSRIDEIRDIVNTNKKGSSLNLTENRVKRKTVLASLPHTVDMQDIKFPNEEKLKSAEYETGSNIFHMKYQFIDGNLIIKEAGANAYYLSKTIERVDDRISYGITAEISISENHLLPTELQTSFQIEEGDIFDTSLPFKEVPRSIWGTDWADQIVYTSDDEDVENINNKNLYKSGNYQISYEMEKKYDGHVYSVPFIVNVKRTPVTSVPSVQYSTQVQSYGWQDFVQEGELAGTSGKAKRLEAIKIQLLNNKYQGTIQVETHVQNQGWQGVVSNGEVSGTTGQSLRLEAIKINLTDILSEKYDIYYQVHAQKFGWLDWAKNGQEAGTTGFGYRLEAIRIKIVPKGETAPGKTNQPSRKNTTPNIKYRTHVQKEGWQSYKKNGATSGTSGQSLRLEAINIQINNISEGSQGSVEYRTHVQTYGWQDWVSDNNLSGTNGESKRLEAIQIKLTGNMEKKYDVYYRVHAQQFGWMGWAKNGQAAGTSGFRYRLEAIQIRLVEKGGSAPGTTTNAFKNSTKK